MTRHRARSVGLVLLVVSLLQLHARPGRAQTAPPDGIDAFVRGDYQRAAQILKPVAERWPGEVDDAAAFFMAALYRNGLGIPRDLGRACALSVRASAGTGPFARLNAAMFAALQPTLTETEQADCLMLATIGFDHRFERAIFNLDAGHWITIELSSRTQSVSATVAYQGKEKRTEVSAALVPGVVFLPIQHTELEIGGTAPGRRHFIEILTWLPEPSVSRWRLWWWLSEVVQEDVIPIANEDLLTAAGNAPPDGVPDLRRLVALRVNAAGGAEWAILDGPNAHGEAIETDLERQEVRAEQEARKAADERVDWKQVRDPDRPPSFAYADADGCSDLFVYAWSADRTEAMTFRADKSALQLSTAPRTFDLARQPNEIALSVEMFERPQRNWPFCTDIVALDGSRRETWKAVAGTVTVLLSAPGVRAREPYRYRVTIQIDGAEFVSPTGIRVRPSRPIRFVAMAGGMVGG